MSVHWTLKKLFLTFINFNKRKLCMQYILLKNIYNLNKSVKCIILIIFQICLTGSCYTTIAITIERFLAIRLPFFMQRYNIKARHFMFPVVIYGVIYNVPRFFEYEVVYNGCREYPNGSMSSYESDQMENITCDSPYVLSYTEMRQNQVYLSVSIVQLIVIELCTI